jgi:hypothetical protein
MNQGKFEKFRKGFQFAEYQWDFFILLAGGSGYLAASRIPILTVFIVLALLAGISSTWSP